MIEPEKIVEKIQQALPDADVKVQDLTGTKDHYKARVVAAQFEGENRVSRHRMIYEALSEEMKGPIHALTLEVYTPGEWEEKSGAN